MVELRLSDPWTFALSGSTGFATPSKKAQALLAYRANPRWPAAPAGKARRGACFGAIGRRKLLGKT